MQPLGIEHNQTARRPRHRQALRDHLCLLHRRDVGLGETIPRQRIAQEAPHPKDRPVEMAARYIFERPILFGHVAQVDHELELLGKGRIPMPARSGAEIVFGKPDPPGHLETFDCARAVEGSRHRIERSSFPIQRKDRVNPLRTVDARIGAIGF